MIKKNQRYFNWANRLLDMFIMYISYAAAGIIWFNILGNEKNIPSLQLIEENSLLLLLVFLIFITVFQYAGLYDSFRFRTLAKEFFALGKAFSICLAIAIGAIFIFKIRDFSRGVLVCFALIAYMLLCLKRLIIRGTLHEIRKRGYNQKHVLIVGSGTLADRLLDSIERNPHFGFHCIGYVGSDRGGNRLGGYETLGSVLREHNPDEVFVAVEQTDTAQIGEIISTCEDEGVRTSVVPFYNDWLPDCATVDVVGRVRLINIRAIPLDVTLNRIIKRLMDVVISVVAIIITSPLLIICTVGVKLSGPGPVLFRQRRVGLNKKEFYMLKFRSMSVNTQSDTAWSTETDSRITPFGAFIRKFSLDELPQFFNVLKGEMSVIGPRPELPFYVEKYRREIPRYMVKHQVKPGITGWAQVNGYRGDTSIEKRINYDIWYIEHWSVLLDAKIVFMTVFGGMINNEKNLTRRKQRQRV